MLLDGREPAVASYDLWNDAIFRFFFGGEKAQRDLRLSFDDGALAAVATSLDLAPDGLIESIAGLVHGDAPEPFARFRELAGRQREFPSTVGLLAAQVLVASRMHADRDYSSHAFWPRFNQTLLRRHDLNPPRDCEIFGAFWRDLQSYLNVTNGGRLGILRLPEDPTETPMRGWRHVNYPLSQCLVREADRADLAEFFLENPTARDCDESRLVAVLEQSQFAFGKAFAATLRQATENPAFASELTRALVEIRAHVVRHAPATSGHANAGQRRARTRLKLATVRGETVLELQQLLDDWRRRAVLDADEWENGVSDDRGYALWSGADYTMFVEGPDGFVTTRDVSRNNTRLRLLIPAARFDDFADALATADAVEVPLSEGLEGLRCFQFSVNESRDESLLRLLGVSSGTRPTARLQGGLQVGSGRFAYGGAPRILVLNSTGSRATINGVVCPVDDRGFVTPERTPKEVGEYEVAVEDERLRYSIVDLREAADSSDGGYVGYLLSVSPALMRAQDLELHAERPVGAAILVGAELQ